MIPAKHGLRAPSAKSSITFKMTRSERSMRTGRDMRRSIEAASTAAPVVGDLGVRLLAALAVCARAGTPRCGGPQRRRGTGDGPDLRCHSQPEHQDVTR
jgi:hypothetical protein